MINYPGGIDDNTTLPNSLSTDLVTSPDLATVQTNQNDAIKAIETKLGTGSSTPVGGSQTLVSASTGQAAWGTLPVGGGGTGATTAAGARSALSAAQNGNNGDITSLTGLTTPLSVAQGGTGLTAFGAGVATFLGTPSSANLATAITDETGSGLLVFGTSPTLITPVISSISNTGTLTLPTITDRLLGRTTTDTLTNKTLTASSNQVGPSALMTTAILLASTGNIGSNFSTTSTSDTFITGATLTITMPAGGRSVVLILSSSSMWDSAAAIVTVKIWRNTIGTGTLLTSGVGNLPLNSSFPLTLITPPDLPSGTIAYNASLSVTSGTGHIDAPYCLSAYLI